MIGLIMGPAGSGKGTQSEHICKKLNMAHMSSGDIFRIERTKDTPRGRMIRKLIDGGNLVPDDVTMEMVSEFIEEKGDVLMDGTPRNLFQAKVILERFGVDFVVVLDVSEEEVIRRLGKRRVCTATGKIFIDEHVSDKDIEECKSNGGEIVLRADDSDLDAIKKRLAIYREMTEPIINFFEEKNVRVIHINGEQSIDAVWKEIDSKLVN